MRTIREAERTSNGNGLTQLFSPAMSEGLLFLKPLNLNRDGVCTDWDVREGKRSVGRIYEDIIRGWLLVLVPE
jgi:hypothetical protein